MSARHLDPEPPIGSVEPPQSSRYLSTVNVDLPDPSEGTDYRIGGLPWS